MNFAYDVTDPNEGERFETDTDPLEEDAMDFVATCFDAETDQGRYSIRMLNGGECMCWCSRTNNHLRAADGTFYFPTRDEAEAAAQLDYQTAGLDAVLKGTGT